MRKYRASGAAPAGGVLLLLIAAVVSGLLFGGILWAIEHFANLYLVVLFPLVAGALAGGLLSFIVRSSKVRNPLIAMLAGLIAGIIIAGTYHFAGYYITFRGEIRTAFEESGEKNVTDAQIDEFTDEILLDEVGDTGFLGYMKLNAREGITVSRVTGSSSSGSGITFQDTGAWIFWGVELLAIVLIAALLARRAAAEPFDERGGAWYGGPRLIGVTDSKSRKDLQNALKNGDYEAAGRLLTTQQLKYPRIEVFTRRSEDSMADVFVLVHNVQRQGRSTLSQQGVISASELERLQRAMSQAAGQPAL
jgi:hypothetical protein